MALARRDAAGQRDTGRRSPFGRGKGVLSKSAIVSGPTPPGTGSWRQPPVDRGMNVADDERAVLLERGAPFRTARALDHRSVGDAIDADADNAVPGLTHCGRTNAARPTATRMSPATNGRQILVREWQIVTVAL